MVKPLTLVMAIYGQPMILAKQVETIIAYDDVVLDKLHVIIVDDHGEPAVGVDVAEQLAPFVASVRVFRVDDDIPWNQMGARNLGMTKADGWCCMIDPDMIFDSPTLHRLMQATSAIQRGRIIKFGLKHVNSGKVDMTSPNTFAIHADDFRICGGYDEDFAGNKGWSDVQLQEVYRQHFKVQERPDLTASFYSSNDEIPDAIVKTLDRNVAENRVKRLKKQGQQKACGGWRRWVSKHKGPNLRFQWTQIFPT
tara:strand:+ start:4431 stop:5186 length:756 start_codon:yes stop_codon:yes gene_type:complete